MLEADLCGKTAPLANPGYTVKHLVAQTSPRLLSFAGRMSRGAMRHHDSSMQGTTKKRMHDSTLMHPAHSPCVPALRGGMLSGQLQRVPPRACE